MKKLQSLASNNFKITTPVIGEVIDNADPLNRGRLKCNIQGITELATIYPWCEVKGSLIGDKDTIGISSAVDIGTFVYISFLYGNPSFPIVDGYVRGAEDSSYLHTVTNLDDTIYKTRTDNLKDYELEPLNDKSTYPNNTVVETKSHVIEIDDTDGNERLSIQHKNGSHYELRPDGNLQTKSTGSTYNITDKNKWEYIAGLVTIKADGNLEFKCDVKCTNLEVESDITAGSNISAKGEVADSEGNLSSLRDTYDSHKHIGNMGILTPVPSITDPKTRWGDFTWSGTEV